MHNQHKLSVAILMLLCLPVYLFAQNVELRGLKNNMRYDSEDEYDQHNYYIGWDAEQGKAIFKTDQGVFSMQVTGNSVSIPVQLTDNNLQYGNSGALYYDGMLYTIFSHENEDQEMEFVVRLWDLETGLMVSQKIYPKSANLESRGLAYNPTDGKVYGLFHLTNIPVTFETGLSPDEEVDAGYCLCTIDLNTMELTPITPGLYYDNFVFLAISPEGRIFSMTSSGTLVEFDATTGLMMGEWTTDEDGYQVFHNKFEHSGVQSQFKRQAACFDKNTGKLYWNGFVNNGMGYNEWGSYGPLSDKDWKTNGKYDTALYEVDINTGAATLIDKITYRITYSCMWVEGGDATEGVNQGESITIADNGMCTYCSNNDLDFSGLTAFQAYIATSYNTATQTITVQHVNEAKAGTGLFLKGIPGTYKVPYCTSYEYALNMLKGVTETKQVEPTEGEYSNFILNPSRTDSSSPYFIRLESATDIAANSAYLQIPTSILNGNANIVGISFEEGVTGISSIASDTHDDTYYSLTGVRVTNPTKGVYIHKGKKVIVED